MFTQHFSTYVVTPIWSISSREGRELDLRGIDESGAIGGSGAIVQKWRRGVWSRVGRRSVV